MVTVRVLFAEDEGLIRLVTAESLRDEGFEVVEAWNGEEAVRLLDGSQRFDVLFTDVRMPGKLDGVDVAVHARRVSPEIPVLVVSGYAAQLTDRLSVLKPIVVFLNKPYKVAEIVLVLKCLTKRIG